MVRCHKLYEVVTGKPVLEGNLVWCQLTNRYYPSHTMNLDHSLTQVTSAALHNNVQLGINGQSYCYLNPSKFETLEEWQTRYNELKSQGVLVLTTWSDDRLLNLLSPDFLKQLRFITEGADIVDRKRQTLARVREESDTRRKRRLLKYLKRDRRRAQQILYPALEKELKCQYAGLDETTICPYAPECPEHMDSLVVTYRFAKLPASDFLRQCGFAVEMSARRQRFLCKLVKEGDVDVLKEMRRYFTLMCATHNRIFYKETGLLKC